MRKLLAIAFSLLFFASCEEVIDVDLDTSEPRLVIEAELVRSAENDSSVARVFLSQTTPFFEQGVTLVNDAIVTITDENGTIYPLENAGNGLFGNAEIIPQFDTNYTLSVTFQGDTYTATERLQPVTSLEFVEQDNEGGFNNDEIELKAFFTDPAGVENYYYFQAFSSKGDMQDTFYDEFFDGNPIFGFYFVEDLEAEDTVTFYLSGVNEQFYNYMFTLLQQGSDQSGGPFQTQPATVRGNMINTTTPENYPLGYFRASEVSILTYTVE